MTPGLTSGQKERELESLSLNDASRHVALRKSPDRSPDFLFSRCVLVAVVTRLALIQIEFRANTP
jgi:hypothetical protein